MGLIGLLEHPLLKPMAVGPRTFVTPVTDPAFSPFERPVAQVMDSLRVHYRYRRHRVGAVGSARPDQRNDPRVIHPRRERRFSHLLDA